MSEKNIKSFIDELIKEVEDELDEAKMCVTALAAILVASRYNKAEEVWEEFSIKEAMRNFDTSIKDILDEKS